MMRKVLFLYLKWERVE